MLSRNFQFFRGNIASQTDNIHAIEQRPRNGVKLIGCANEQDLGQIHPQVEIMIKKFSILFRIENLKHGRCRITLIRATHFVNFIEHNYRI